MPHEPTYSLETSPKESSRISRDHKRTTVRFTDDEFERIQEEARISGFSVPDLLRESHFKRRKLKLLFNEGERHWVCAELRRIGSNVNQIAYRVNSGTLEGWYEEFGKVLQLLSELQQMAVGAYGLR
ncbi:MAG: MobC family plasmid mobilization relaxosome protein [Bdellovibrionota bacterium]